MQVTTYTVGSNNRSMPQFDLENLGQEIISKLNSLEAQVNDVKKHESQNGGWIAVNETLATLVNRVEELDEKISNPEKGIIARVRDIENWKASTTVIVEENKTQNDRLVSLEREIALQGQKLAFQQKFLVGIALTAGGLVVKSLMALIIS